MRTYVSLLPSPSSTSHPSSFCPSTSLSLSLQVIIKVSWRLIPIFFLSLADQPPGLSVHDGRPSPGLLPAVVVLHKAGDQLVRKLHNNNTGIVQIKY